VRSLGEGLLGRAQAQDRRLRNMDKSLEVPRLSLKPRIHIGPGVWPVLPSTTTVLPEARDYQGPVGFLGGGLLIGAQAQDRGLRNMDKSVEVLQLN
jgi:hypothetical protein